MLFICILRTKYYQTKLKLNIQKTKIMAPSLITPRQIDGETMETVTDLMFLGSKVTADSIAAMKLKDACSLGKNAITNLDSVLKSRDITLPTKICIVKLWFFQ